NLGMTQAICLDGGLSSSLYYRGKYLSRPFRKITDAIVITRHKDIGLPGASHIKIKRFLI
ncbi:MAG TPA: phosphodiester glycosidase family protein, partial [Syntrophomonas sp.]|nr:phosphodiester glycosidase family protein [Syntrophomonas sp.]